MSTQEKVVSKVNEDMEQPSGSKAMGDQIRQASQSEIVYNPDISEHVDRVYTKEDCDNDPQFQEPYIEEEEWRNEPVRHYYVHGGFRGTKTKFCFYFPQKEVFQGRFFQRMMPVQGDETVAQRQVGTEDDAISFCVSHGAIYIDTNMGGIVNGGGDESLAYRASGASAEFARVLARRYYGTNRVYGYVYGGSGGGYKTMSCLESTDGIWDGGIPFVIGSPVAMPSVFTVRAHAMRILRHKMDEIADAIEPGGSGDPYAGLDEEEQEALKEVTLMGFPMKTWAVWRTIGEGALPVLAPAIPAMDPSYFTDFWTKEGYLGSNPDGSAVRDRIHFETEIKEIIYPERGIQSLGDTVDEKNAYGVDEAWKNIMGKGQVLPVFKLREFPPAEGDPYTKGLTLTFLDGKLQGEKIHIIWAGYSLAAADADPMGGRDLAELLKGASEGDRVLVDNSDYIAIQTYHRHQVPEPEFHAWDQFRGENGEPIYPQRQILVGPIIAKNGAGSAQSGRIHGKCMVLESLMDESAFPWQADWYRGQVTRNSGKKEEENFRLYYMEHCMHTDCEEGNGGDHQHIVSYVGALNQALLDLADWVEKDVEPAQTSGYTMNGGQVLIANHAKDRKGLQPVVRLTANGGTKAMVREGEEVRFEAFVELPAGSGDLEEVLWDFCSDNRFAEAGDISKTVRNEDGTGTAGASCTFRYDKPGTYFAVVRAASNHRMGDRFTRVWNMARVRIIVGDGSLQDQESEM